ncbi:hypothetical protein [Pontibacter populi]|uniref:Lipoprotein n=1 Tax=Pontibacter populi TaxID=890055 RepID=A0ABV1RQ96_9BACT
MKKIIYSMSMAVAILFTACSEDRGTTTEVADANENENVNPAHIRNYPLPGTAGNSTAYVNTNNSATSTQPTPKLSATELVYAYYNETKPEEIYRSHNYQFSATQLVGGRAAEEGAETDNNTQKSGTTMAPSSTTASGESRGATDSRASGNEEKRIIDYNKQPDNSGSQKKKRLTPYQ